MRWRTWPVSMPSRVRPQAVPGRCRSGRSGLEDECSGDREGTAGLSEPGPQLILVLGDRRNTIEPDHAVAVSGADTELLCRVYGDTVFGIQSIAPEVRIVHVRVEEGAVLDLQERHRTANQNVRLHAFGRKEEVATVYVERLVCRVHWELVGEFAVVLGALVTELQGRLAGAVSEDPADQRLLIELGQKHQFLAVDLFIRRFSVEGLTIEGEAWHEGDASKSAHLRVSALAGLAVQRGGECEEEQDAGHQGHTAGIGLRGHARSRS